MRTSISILGAGWLGLPLALRLQAQGYLVKASCTSPEKLEILKNQGLDAYLIRIDEGKIQGDAAVFFNSEILFVNIPPSRRRPDVETWYPQQVQAIMEQAKASGVKNLLFIGSTSVYGDVNQAVDESSALLPDTASARSLVKAEAIVRQAYVDAGQGSILRMSGLVGGDRKAGRFFAGKKDVPEGNAPINLVHLDDCLGVIELILQKGHWGYLYNVCADEHPHKAQFYTQQALQQGFEAPTFLDDPTPRFKIVKNDKIKRDLGYQFQHPDPLYFT
jgi:nucleoside-diphosphate-sugar epimerase